MSENVTLGQLSRQIADLSAKLSSLDAKVEERRPRWLEEYFIDQMARDIVFRGDLEVFEQRARAICSPYGEECSEEEVSCMADKIRTRVNELRKYKP